MIYNVGDANAVKKKDQLGFGTPVLLNTAN
jgi:hypothetical protein